jgi:PAS domain S-box-containing protein
MGEENSINSRRWVAAIAGVAVLVGLYVISRHNYLLFHTLGEGFSIAVACGIFMVAWNSRRFLDNNYVLLLGMAFLFIAGMDLLHSLAYRGMNIFEDRSANLPTQLWVAARYIQAITLAIAPFLIGRKVRAEHILSVYAAVTAILLLSIFYWKNFPVCFVEGQGLTPFKKISEYVISLMLAASAYALYLKRDAFEKKVLHFLYGAIFTTIAAELAFTFYINAYGFSNLVGHFLKIVAFFLIYKAVIETGLREPYSLLFRNLKDSEDRFRSFSEASFEGIVISEGGKLLDMNPQAAVMFGYESPSDMIGINGFKLVAPESHENVKRIVTEESEELYEATFVKRDGSKFDAEVLGRMFDYHGRRVRVAAIRDITERKLAEDKIKLNEARIEALYELSQMTGVPMMELSAFVLEHAVELTKSKIGFIGFVISLFISKSPRRAYGQRPLDSANQ